MNYPHSIGIVKVKISYNGRHRRAFPARPVDNFQTLWIAPGKCRTNPENVGLNPENVGIGRHAKTAESRTTTAFAAVPRARARKHRNKNQETAREKPARGTLWVPPASRLPLRSRVPASGDAKCPTNHPNSTRATQKKAASQLAGRKKRSSVKESGQPLALRKSARGFCAAVGGQIRVVGTRSGMGSTGFLPTTKIIACRASIRAVTRTASRVRRGAPLATNS